METKTCYICGKMIANKNEIGINKKMHGRTVEKFFCYECLAETLEVTVEELFAKIEEFKAQGCALFE